MRHQAFLNILGRTEADNAIARNAAAGLLAVRQLVIWADDPGLLEQHYIAAVTHRIEQADAPIAHILTSAVRQMYNQYDNTRVLAPFVAYAVILVQRMQVTLAIDTLETVVEVLSINRMKFKYDALFIANCYNQLGDAQFLEGRWQDARESFAQVSRLMHDKKRPAEQDLALLAAVRDCMIDSSEGHLESAKIKIDKTLTSITESTPPHIHHRALMVRGGVSQRMGNFSDALIDYYAAFEIADSPATRELALADIAATLVTMGCDYDIAINIQAYLYKNGTSPHVRLLSAINSLELCMLNARSMPDAYDRFKGWWKIFLRLDAKTPELRMHGWLYYANGIAYWESRENAIKSYREVISRAKSAGVHHIAAQAKNALEALI